MEGKERGEDSKESWGGDRFSAYDLRSCHGVPELFEADIAQANAGDQALVAGRHHRGQLVIETCADAPVTGQPEVHRGQPADPQAAQVVLDTFSQLVRIIERQDGTGVVAPDRDLTDDRQPVGIGVERVVDQVVDDSRGRSTEPCRCDRLRRLPRS